MTRTLGFRIFAGFAAAVVLTLGVAGIVFFSLLGGYRSALDRNTLQQVADQVLFGVNQFVDRGAAATEVGRYLATQSRETGALLFVLDPNGRIVRDFSPGAEFADLQLPITLATVRRQPNAWVAGEFTAAGESLPFLARLVPVDRFGSGAIVAVALPEGGAGDVVQDLLPRLLLSGIAGLAVAMIAGLVITRSLYDPLRHLTSAARAVGLGRYDTRVPESGPEETRQLARAFNRMTTQVEANEKTLQDFMADISHELRTPLTSIRGFAQAIGDGAVRDAAQMQRSVQIIDDEARRMLRLVEDLLDLSRIQAGTLVLQRERVDPGELVAHIGEVFAQRAEEAGVQLAVQAAPGCPPVDVDYDRMVQVFTNLVDNALRHTAAGSVRIDATPLAAGVRFSVADSGEGIPPDELARLFDRFYRGERTARRRGTGLGLAITRELVRAHGGEIQVESTIGLGTRFTFTLPAAPRGPNPPRP